MKDLTAVRLSKWRTGPLRPILMTTAAMVTGLLPLLPPRGGAASRFSIGLVCLA